MNLNGKVVYLLLGLLIGLLSFMGTKIISKQESMSVALSKMSERIVKLETQVFMHMGKEKDVVQDFQCD